MKAKLVPIYFPSKDEQFQKQIKLLNKELADFAEILNPVALGEPLPEEADAALFPQILGEAYTMWEEIEKIRQAGFPLLVITSDFATFSMWDWEVNNFLKSKGLSLLLPHDLETSKKMCRMLAVKREMTQTKFRIYQDSPGEGMQSWIFKCFYWFREECTEKIQNKFGVELDIRSYTDFAKRAADISSNDVKDEWSKWDFKTEGMSDRMIDNAVRIFLALERDMDDESIRGMGINCLNESYCSNTTPCLAWNMMYEKYGMVWACEADTVTLTTQYLLHKSLEAPIMMTNVYPFLMNKAATAHEKIPGFPEFIKNPEDHVLLAHCGNFGLVPRQWCTSWTCRPPVLAMVNEESHVLDARFPEGPLTGAKLDASMEKIFVTEGDLEGYVQYDESSDCRNGGIWKVKDGYKFLDKVYSHHMLFMPGNHQRDIETIGSIFNIGMDTL